MRIRGCITLTRGGCDPEIGRFLEEDPIQDEWIRLLSDSYKKYVAKQGKESLNSNSNNRSEKENGDHISKDYYFARFIDKDLGWPGAQDINKYGINWYKYCNNNTL